MLTVVISEESLVVQACFTSLQPSSQIIQEGSQLQTPLHLSRCLSLCLKSAEHTVVFIR